MSLPKVLRDQAEIKVKANNAITGISSSDVTSALGYTPYNSTNPNGYTSNTGTITEITMNSASKGTSGNVNLGGVVTTGTSGSTQTVAGNLSVSGTLTASTATAGTNSTQVATTAFVQTAVSNLVSSAPETLDTLNELASALGDDPNFATTVAGQIGSKIDASKFQVVTELPDSPTEGVFYFVVEES